MTLTWPPALTDIELLNMSITELWMLKESMNAGVGKLSHTIVEFGFQKSYYTIGEQQYQIKYKHVVNMNPNRDRLSQPDNQSKLLIFWLKKL